MAYSDIIMASTPTAYWRMNDNQGTVIADSSGNNYNGITVNSPTLHLPGPINESGSFSIAINQSSSNQYCSIPDAPALRAGTGEYAIECWVNFTNTSTSGLFNKADITAPFTGPSILLNVQGLPGSFYFRDVSTNGFIINTPGGFYNNGNWNHICCQRKQTSPGVFYLQIYINGILSIQSPTQLSSVINQTSTQPIIIGNNGTTQSTTGYISEVAYYVGKSLSASDIAARYTYFQSKLSITTPTSLLKSVYQTPPKIGNGYGFQKSLNPPVQQKFKNIDSNFTNPNLLAIDSTLSANFMSGRTVFNGSALPNTKVNLYDRRSGVLVRSAISDSNGNWTFLDLINNGNNIYYVVAIDPDGIPLYNSIIYDRVQSVPYSISLSGGFMLNPTTGTMDGSANIDSGMPPFTPSLISGTIPPGLSLGISPDNRHVIASGTSSFYQDFYFTIQVQNGQGYVAQQSYQALLPTSLGKAQINEADMFSVVFFSNYDTHFGAVSTLMPMDSLIDVINPSITWTTQGATNLSSEQSKFGGVSLYCPNNGSGGGITTPFNKIYDLSSTNDWTIECWVYLTDPHVSGGMRTIFTNQWTNGDTIPVICGIGNQMSPSTMPTGAPYVGFYNGSAWNVANGQTAVPLNIWTHLAFVRKSSMYYVYMNGVMVGFKEIFASVPAPNRNYPYYIGTNWSLGTNAYNLGGYIDDFRITKGVRRYNNNFALATEASPKSANLNSDMYWDTTSSQLTFENGNIVDDTGLVLWASNGSISINSSNPYSGNYSAQYDGSSTCYLSLPTAPMISETDPFTIDLWFYFQGPLNAQPYGPCLFSQNNNAGSGEQGVFIASDGTLNFYRGSSFSNSFNIASSSGQVTSEQWHHYALVYDGSTMMQFLDGVKAGEAPSVKGWTRTSEFFKLGNSLVPSYPQYQRNFKGWIDNFRITRGVARWTDTFIPPTTIASIYDAKDTSHHIERMLAQPTTMPSIRLGSPSLVWNSSSINPYLQLSNPSSTHAFVSFDRWGSFTGNYWFEVEIELVSDNANRKHFGLYLDAGATGQNGYRLTHIDGYFCVDKWSNGAQTVIYSASYPDSPYSWVVGNRYNYRVEVQGSTFTLYVNGMFAFTFTDATYIGLRPGVHSYGNVLNIRKVETGSLSSSQTTYIPPNGYNVAYGRPGYIVNAQAYYTGTQSTNNYGYFEFTDNVNTTASYIAGIGNGTTPLQAIIDLGQPTIINQVIVWHYWGDSRTYSGTKTEISLDGVTWTTIFDSAVSGKYVEQSTGHIMNFTSQPVRYIRDNCAGSTSNTATHWSEIQASLQ